MAQGTTKVRSKLEAQVPKATPVEDEKTEPEPVPEEQKVEADPEEKKKLLKYLLKKSKKWLLILLLFNW